MMEGPIPFGGPVYLVLLLILIAARGADFLSTWIATPNLVLEANPIARALRFRWGLPVNVVLCFLFAFWPLPAIIIATTSALVAARNFQVAWLMRSMGEYEYRHWMVERLEQTPITLFLGCLFGQTLLFTAVGAILAACSRWQVVPFGIGMGFIAYAFTVLVFTLISLWRRRRPLE